MTAFRTAAASGASGEREDAAVEEVAAAAPSVAAPAPRTAGRSRVNAPPPSARSSPHELRPANPEDTLPPPAPCTLDLPTGTMGTGSFLMQSASSSRCSRADVKVAGRYPTFNYWARLNRQPSSTLGG